MAERRSLVEGLKPASSPVDSRREKEFVFGATGSNTMEAPIQQQPTATLARTPISTRIRSDFGAALKRASLERQLKGIEPSTLQDILEEAIEPWLKSNGYLS